MGFPRQEYRSGLPFPSPGDLPDPEIKPTSPALTDRFFSIEPPEKLLSTISTSMFITLTYFWIDCSYHLHLVLLWFNLGLFFAMYSFVTLFCPIFCFFLYKFIYFNWRLLYSIVLVLPYINMNPPQVYTCSPSWTPLPTPSPGSSQCISLMHRTWTGDSFHIWYYTCFNAILPNHPTLVLSHRVQKTVLYICVSFAVLHTGLSLPSF